MRRGPSLREYIGGPLDGDFGQALIVHDDGEYRPGIWVDRHRHAWAAWYWKPTNYEVVP